MLKNFLFLSLVISSVFGVSAQKPELAAILIPAELKENANAVVRSSEETYAVTSQNAMRCSSVVAVTVLNEYGTRNLNLVQSYSPRKKIQRIQATLYDAGGRELKTFKRKDFKDVSMADGYSIFSDDRLLYLDFTPTAYPFTIEFECEYTTSNTAQLPRWSALTGFFVSSEKDVVTVLYPPELGFFYRESNFDTKFSIAKQESPGVIRYEATHIAAVKGEENSPEFYKVSPTVNFRLNKFSLEGVQGEATDWKSFGKWYYDKLLTGTDALPDETKARIRTLVGEEKDPMKIAAIVYKFVQDKTRYVSIQVGIGGYKPMNAADVDKLGYGDCKALTNYTRALLAVAGVPSYFTLVYAGDGSRRGMLPDFASPQGNHAILTMPTPDGYLWMECTSPINPFGFQGRFTDGRDVLVVKPDGGEIVHTKPLLEKENQQVAKGTYAIAPDGTISGNFETVSSGASYDAVFRNERLSAKDQELWYKNQLSGIGNLKLEKIGFQNDRASVKFTEELSVSATNYASVSGNRLLFALNAFHRFGETPKRYRLRHNPLEIERGYYEQDEMEITIPDGYTIEALPSDFSLKTKFGEYECKAVNKNGRIAYSRSLLVKDGFYPSEEYENYRQFCEQVARQDASKAVLVKKS